LRHAPWRRRVALGIQNGPIWASREDSSQAGICRFLPFEYRVLHRALIQGRDVRSFNQAGVSCRLDYGMREKFLHEHTLLDAVCLLV